MNDQSKMSRQQTLPGFDSATSSPASEDGHMPSDWLDIPTTGPCGQVPAHASLSARQALAKGLMTPDTYGRTGDGSLISAALQSSLESRLQALLGVDGSPEYVLTWKYWDMGSGPQICALRASQPRTSGKGFGGWPTPNAIPPNRGGLQTNPQKALERRQQGHMLNLDDAAVIAGWVNPTAQDGSRGNKPPRPHDTGVPLSQQAVMAGLATPTGRDHKDGVYCPNVPVNALLGRQAWTTGSHAQTEKRGALNPALSRWLMGYPIGWDSCGAMAMQSCRKSRRRSSKR